MGNDAEWVTSSDCHIPYCFALLFKLMSLLEEQTNFQQTEVNLSQTLLSSVSIVLKPKIESRKQGLLLIITLLGLPW